MKRHLQNRLAQAIRYFWRTRTGQGAAQGSRTGRRDQGSRSEVTGGKQLDGLVNLVTELLVEAGVPDVSVYRKRSTAILPGFFRPTKQWDLLVAVKGHLLATIEFKSQVGSFGNNFNNRTEEAIGSATDLWTAFREGAFKDSPRPWLGYFMLLEKAPGSTAPVAVDEPHFPVFSEFCGASYAKRYELFCQRLVRERLYDAACFLLSDKVGGSQGRYEQPSREIGFESFMASLTGHALGYAQIWTK